MVLSPVQILCGFVLPAVLVVLAEWLATKFTKDGRWVFGPVVAIGFGLAYWNVEPKPDWPPGANVIYLLFYVPSVLGALTLADALFTPPLWLRAIVLLICFGIAAHLFLARLVPETLSARTAEAWTAVAAIIAVIWWLTFETIAKSWTGITVPLLLIALSATCAVVLALGWHIQSSGLMAGAIFAICCGGLVLGAFSSREFFSRGFAQTAVLILLLLLVHGYFYSDDTLTPRQEFLAGFLIFAPLLALLGGLRQFRERSRPWQILLRVALVFGALGVVCGLTIYDYVHTDNVSSNSDD
jgi:hypothetical protein